MVIIHFTNRKLNRFLFFHFYNRVILRTFYTLHLDTFGLAFAIGEANFSHILDWFVGRRLSGH